jgi:hypothetical protein
MNNNFCKVYQIDEHHQVLCHLIVEDDEHGEPETKIEIKTFIQGLQVQTKLSSEHEITEENLDKVTEKYAKDFFKNMQELLK